MILNKFDANFFCQTVVVGKILIFVVIKSDLDLFLQIAVALVGNVSIPLMKSLVEQPQETIRHAPAMKTPRPSILSATCMPSWKDPR